MYNLRSFVLLCGLCAQAYVVPNPVKADIDSLITRQDATAYTMVGDTVAGGAAVGGAMGGGGGVADLTASINIIAKNVNDTQEAVEPFKGGSIKGLLGLLKINSDVVALGDSIKASTEIAAQTPTLDTMGSVAVSKPFLMLQPQINTLLDKFQTKRADFDKAGFKILDVTSLIRDDLTIQQKGAADLGDSLIKALDPMFRPIARQINLEIQNNFTVSVKAFSGRGGKIKIPAKAVPKLSDLLDSVAKALGIVDMDGAGGGKKKDGANAALALGHGDPAGLTADISPGNPVTQIPDTNLNALADDENDLTGIPPLVLVVLRRYDVI